jgi:hypothetical protein
VSVPLPPVVPGVAGLAACLVGTWLALPLRAQTAASRMPVAVPAGVVSEPCESLVVVRCAARNAVGPATSRSPPSLDAARRALVLARAGWEAGPSDPEAIVIVGERSITRLRMLSQLLQEAAAPLPAISFQTVENADGTRCTCASAPCVMNCCVCSPRR